MKPDRSALRRPRLALLFLPVCFAPLFLVSCLDYKEELWISGGGSGKIHSIISIDSTIAAAALESGNQDGGDVFDTQLRDMFRAADGAEV